MSDNSVYGPKYGSDLNIYTCISNNPSAAFDRTYCKKLRYERSIRDTEEDFSIENYERFYDKFNAVIFKIKGNSWST
uniref:Uncharacterized protein n=1 Tax=Rhizophagus irregularis (strain DAOM 181602 / DAOM 197198 / MUCL 43194) TaxID=747089 RepID=U9USJ3_RHIID